MNKSRITEWAVVLGCLILFFISRLSSISLNRELNPDESHFLAQAMRFETDMTPWLSVDAETSGPVSGWVLVGMHKLGMPYTYRAVHLLAACILSGALVCGWLALRRLLGARVALVTMSLLSVLLAVTAGSDYAHYSSEVIPLFLFAVGFLLVTVGLPLGRLSLVMFFCAGLAFGMSPWTKLQAAPLAACFALWSFLHLWFSRENRGLGKRCLLVMLGLLAGLLTPGLVLLGWLWKADGVTYFWSSYVVANQAYAGLRTPLELILAAIALLQANLFVVPLVLLVTVLLTQRSKLWKGLPVQLRVLAVLLPVTCAFTLLKTNTQFGHYQLLTIVPLFIMIGLCLRPLLDEGQGACEGGGRWEARLCLVAVLLTLSLPFYRTIDTYRKYYSPEALAVPTGAEAQAEVVRHLCPRTGCISVVGFSPGVHVTLGLPPASRHIVTHTLMMEHPALGLMRKSYLADLELSKPELIVVVGSMCPKWALTIFERSGPFPEFEAYLQKNYHISEMRRASDGVVVTVYSRDHT